MLTPLVTGGAGGVTVLIVTVAVGVVVGVATPDDDLTDDPMRLLAWLVAHPTGSLAAAAQALDLPIADVEVLCADLVAEGMIERAPMQ